MNEYKTHGAFSWNELMTTNVEDAKKFYSEVFGWSIIDEKMDDLLPYSVIKIGDKSIGGIMEIPIEAKAVPPMWGLYVTVDDVDKCSKKVKELGGKIIVPPKDIPKIGRFCVFQDPEGAVISAIKYL